MAKIQTYKNEDPLADLTRTLAEDIAEQVRQAELLNEVREQIDEVSVDLGKLTQSVVRLHEHGLDVRGIQLALAGIPDALRSIVSQFMEAQSKTTSDKREERYARQLEAVMKSSRATGAKATGRTGSTRKTRKTGQTVGKTEDSSAKGETKRRGRKPATPDTGAQVPPVDEAPEADDAVPYVGGGAQIVDQTKSGKGRRGRKSGPSSDPTLSGAPDDQASTKKRRGGRQKQNPADKQVGVNFSAHRILKELGRPDVLMPENLAEAVELAYGAEWRSKNLQSQRVPGGDSKRITFGQDADNGFALLKTFMGGALRKLKAVIAGELDQKLHRSLVELKTMYEADPRRFDALLHIAAPMWGIDLSEPQK